MRISLSIALAVLSTGCIAGSPTGEEAPARADSSLVQSAIPAARLAGIKAALPQVGWSRLQALFTDPDTYWYDHQSMASSYQETGFPGGGAKDNAHWRELIADTGVNDVNSNPATGAEKVYDTAAKRWRFPVATTAGADDSANLVLVDFLALPKDAAGKRQSIPLSTHRDQIHLSWDWQYPNGTTIGEVLFIQDGANLLATEVRTRTRYAAGWATNSFRPFPEAGALSASIKQHRPDWQNRPGLAAVVQQLDGQDALTAKTLTATGLTGTFDQTGVLDVLPDFGDDALVRELLTTTTFVSAYGATWRQGAAGSAFAASTTAALSIVPQNYTAGLIEVRETSCMRCHKEGGRPLEQFYPGLTLYGEVWGKDGIFSFHPFDESYYPQLDLDSGAGIQDNRHMNPALSGMGFIENFDPAKHTGPFYERR